MFNDISVNRDQSVIENIRGWLAPSGSSFVDGIRLAAINGAFLIAALVLAALIAVIGGILDWFLPMPSFSPGLLVLALSIVFGAVVWKRYTAAHARQVQARGRTTSPETYGVIGGLPFTVLAFLLLSSGFFGLAVSTIGLNAGGIASALGRLALGLLFGLLAAANFIIARLVLRDYR